MSFEALEAHRPCLEELIRIDGGGYDYLITAVSDQAKTLTLYGPVVNGAALTGLNSVDGSIFNDWHGSWLASLVGSAIPVAEAYSFQFLETKIKCQALDEILEHLTFAVPVDRIAAIKIDVEGHERAVLDGARQTIENHRPLIVTEGANRVPQVADFMLRHGYRNAERRGDQIVESDDLSMEINGYWLHETRRADYAAMGLLIGCSPAPH